MLVLPCAVVSCEFASFAISPYGTWGALGHTQFSNLPLMQLVSVTGLCRHRVSHWLVRCRRQRRLGKGVRLESFPADGVLVCRRHCDRAHRCALATGSLSADGGDRSHRLHYGTRRPSRRRESDKVGRDSARPFWQLDTGCGLAGLVRNTQPLNAYLAAQSRREAQAGAKVVFWPEGQAVAAKESEAELIELGRQTARGESIYLGMGMVVMQCENQELKIENRFLFLDPEGHTLFDYTKQNPVPGGEARSAVIPIHDYRLPTVGTPYGRIAAAICFDMDFPRFIRQAGEARADMILAPSNDWRAIDPLHTHMACLRGIELGCAVLRQTSNGLSQAVDYEGHVLARMDHFTTPGNERVMVTHVPVHGTPTFYARFGDVFSWGCVVGLAALACLGVAPLPGTFGSLTRQMSGGLERP